MINHKEKYKVTAEDILTFLNYKKEINVNMLKEQGPLMNKPFVDRMKLVLCIYQDICDVVNNPENLKNVLKEIKRYKNEEEKRESGNYDERDLRRRVYQAANNPGF
jgi:hypothetical protein